MTARAINHQRLKMGFLFFMKNGYQQYLKEPNTIHKKGRLFTKYFHFETKNEFKERLIRVYVPSTYDFDNPNKRFKTIYMWCPKRIQGKV